MADQSTRTTGNDPVEGVDPGGTRPTKAGQPGKDGGRATEQTVESGDRNPRTSEGDGPTASSS
ncbi:MAG: hypothetical protein JOZ42_13035 [Acetobacteraceae bacterium]|nr:hypothetical protein [Acetobacteraceae bacterium]